MTLKELKHEVDRLLATQSPETDTNITNIRLQDAGDWRFVEVTVHDTTVPMDPYVAMDRIQKLVEISLRKRAAADRDSRQQELPLGT